LLEEIPKKKRGRPKKVLVESNKKGGRNAVVGPKVTLLSLMSTKLVC